MASCWSRPLGVSSMIDPASGPFLFDTSSESWLARSQSHAVRSWLHEYLSHHEVFVSAATVVERIRGYALLALRGPDERRRRIEAARMAYLRELPRVFSL